jgi:hypothetical protein
MKQEYNIKEPQKQRTTWYHYDFVILCKMTVDTIWIAGPVADVLRDGADWGDCLRRNKSRMAMSCSFIVFDQMICVWNTMAYRS